MNSTRQNKINRLIQKEIGNIFQREGNSLFPGKLITITAARVTSDFSIARIYLSIFPSENSDEILKEINNNLSAHFRGELGKKIKNQLRSIPEVHFYIDDSLDYVERIDNLLRQ